MSQLQLCSWIITHADDLVRSLELAVEHRLQGIYTLGTSESYDFNTMAAMIKKNSGRILSPRTLRTLSRCLCTTRRPTSRRCRWRLARNRLCRSRRGSPRMQTVPVADYSFMRTECEPRTESVNDTPATVTSSPITESVSVPSEILASGKTTVHLS